MEEIRGRHGHGLLILDEPTVFLPREGVERLFSLIRTVAAEGATVLFVSHDLDEVREITDRVTVLRDGALVGTVVTAATSEAQFVRDDHRPSAGCARRGPSRRPDRQGRRRRHRRADAAERRATSPSQMHDGEVVGLTGLLGSGFEEVPHLLYGARPARPGC